MTNSEHETTVAEDGFVAVVASRPDGRWGVDIWEHDDRGEHKFLPRDIERIYGVSASGAARTEAKARRLASRMLVAVRKADAAMHRGRFEVTR